jgi:parallel beta-helix repeat protein
MRINMKSIPIIFIVLAITAVPAAADTITVDVNGGADYTSIQKAVNNATAGDTILVYPGNYTGSVDVKKKLTIMSQSGNPADTIVHTVSPDGFFTDDVFDVMADGVIISGFTLTGAIINEFGDDQAGVHLDNAKNCTISNNYLSNNLGLFLTRSNNNTLSNNEVTHNALYGIWLWNSSNNELKGNNVSKNGQEGIYVYVRSDNNIFINNTITSNGGAGVMIIDNCNGNVFERNTVSKNHVGISIAVYNVLLSNNTVFSNSIGIMVTERYNVLHNNTVFSNPTGIYLNHAKNCTLDNNLVINNGNGISMTKSTGNRLTGNNASNNSGYGIYLKNSSTGNLLISNIALSNGKGDILIEDMENNTLRERGEYVPFPNAVFACIVLLVLFLMLSKMNEN